MGLLKGLLFVTFLMTVACEEQCPKRCICEKSGAKWLKLKCGDHLNILNSTDDIDFGSISPNILQL